MGERRIDERRMGERRMGERWIDELDRRALAEEYPWP
jgi:hypothetical protein